MSKWTVTEEEVNEYFAKVLQLHVKLVNSTRSSQYVTMSDGFIYRPKDGFPCSCHLVEKNLDILKMQ